MRRREFLGVLGGATAAWPLAARGQQNGRMRLVGWLDGQDENTASRALTVMLRDHGWVEGSNLKIERRVFAGDESRLRSYAAELVSLKPDVIIAGGAAPARAVQQATRTIPIIFTRGGDAAVNGLVKDIAKPEGNITGFSSAEPTIAGKWLELLKDAAPNIVRVGVVFKPEVAPTSSKYLAAIRAAARKLSLPIVELAFHDVIELVRLIDTLAVEPNQGLLILPPMTSDSPTIIKLAAQHHLPAIYPLRAFSAEGGLISYSSDDTDQHRRAAVYVDRLLRGAKVAEMPVQFPSKYFLVVNTKTAKAIDLNIPEAFMLNADEVIE